MTAVTYISGLGYAVTYNGRVAMYHLSLEQAVISERRLARRLASR